MAMKTYTLDEMKDEFIGKIGTPERDKFEQDLKEELYVYLCEKQEQNALLLNSSSLPARVIDAANMDPTPLAPRFFRTIAIYMVMGGLFPLLFFFIGLLKQHLHPKRNESAQQVENWGIEWYN